MKRFIGILILFLTVSAIAFSHIVNYSFDNFITFGLLSMDSIGYVSSSNRPLTPPPVVNTTPVYTIVTGKVFSTSING